MYDRVRVSVEFGGKVVEKEVFVVGSDGVVWSVVVDFMMVDV